MSHTNVKKLQQTHFTKIKAKNTKQKQTDTHVNLWQCSSSEPGGKFCLELLVSMTPPGLTTLRLLQSYGLVWHLSDAQTVNCVNHRFKLSELSMLGLNFQGIVFWLQFESEGTPPRLEKFRGSIAPGFRTMSNGNRGSGVGIDRAG